MNNQFTINVTISLTQFKMLQEGAAMATDLFNKSHPKHGYIVHDKIIDLDSFLNMAITNEYQNTLAEFNK